MDVKENVLRMDPRAELILLLLVNIIAFTYDRRWVEILLIGLLAFLQIICGQKRSAVKWLAFFAVLVAVQYFLLPVLPKVLSVTLVILTVFARKIFPCMMVGGLIFQTVPVRYLIVALRKWNVPQNVIIPLAVTIRYFPAIKEEHRHIRDAMKLKQIHGLGKKIECSMIPLLVSAIQTSDELSAAAITRGIENPCPKTSVADLRFHALDYLCLGVAAVLAVYTVLIG